MAEVTGLHEFFQQLRVVIYGIWRKRWYMIAVSWLVAVVVWTAVFSMPYRYQASAQVFIDTQTVLPSIAKNLGIDVDVRRKVDLVRDTLITRPNLERIIQRTDYLERFAGTDAGLDQMVTYLQRQIRVSPIEGNRFRIVFEIDDKRLTDRQRAEVARIVVNGLLSFFLEGNVANGLQNTDDAEEFLGKQVADYAARLEEADQALASFRQNNLFYLGGQASYLQRLRTEQGALRRTRQDVVELQVSLEELQNQLKAIPPTVKIGGTTRSNSAPADPLDERIEDLEKRVDELRAFGYTDKHPDVVSTLNQLDGLKAQRLLQREALEKELADAAANGESPPARSDESSNPVYEQVYLQTIEARQQIAKLERRAEDQERLVMEMETRAKKVPEIEAEEKRLNRDYNTLQQQYNELIGQRESLALKRSVEGVDDSLALQIIEPPVTPQSPSGPPRLLYLSFGLAMALVAGVGVAFVMSQLRPVVISVEQLRAHFGLPVLGSITRIISEEDARRKSVEYLAFSGATISLFIVFMALTALDLFVSPTIAG